MRDWYATVGANAWRLEEFQHYYGNATFDDQVTTDAATFLLRLYVEKLDARYKAPVDRAIAFVLDSQYPVGGWPQRFPLRHEFAKHNGADYTSYLTFNDDVAWENISFLLQCYQVLGDQRLLDPIRRGMSFFLVSQQGAPNPGWSLQYTLDLKPAAARTYEPLSLATHTTASNLEHLLTFYELTGDTRYLARVPDGIDWLDKVQLGEAGCGRQNPSHVHRAANQSPALRASARFQCRQRRVLRRLRSEEGNRPLLADAQDRHRRACARSTRKHARPTSAYSQRNRRSRPARRRRVAALLRASDMRRPRPTTRRSRCVTRSRR